MTKTECEAAVERCEKATEGPWEECEELFLDDRGYEEPTIVRQADAGPKTITTIRVGLRESYDNSTFIAKSRADLPAALDMLERAMVLLECAELPGYSLMKDDARELLREWHRPAKQ